MSDLDLSIGDKTSTLDFLTGAYPWLGRMLAEQDKKIAKLQEEKDHYELFYRICMSAAEVQGKQSPECLVDEVLRLRTWISELEPHLDALICYASTTAEHPINKTVKEIRDALRPIQNNDT